MGLASWLAQVRQATNMVDAQFGEQVLLLPWQENEFVGSGPDTTRPVVGPVTAIFKTTRSMPANVAPQMESKFAEADAYLSINHEYIEQCDLEKGDRIQLINRNDQEYEVNYISPTPFRRSRIFLIMVKEPPA